MSSTYKIEDNKLIRTQTTEFDISLAIEILTAIRDNNGYWEFKNGYIEEFDSKGKFRWEDMQKLVKMDILKVQMAAWCLTYEFKDNELQKILRDLNISEIIDGK